MFVSYLYIAVTAEVFTLLAVYCAYLHVQNNKLYARLMNIDVVWVSIRGAIDAELKRTPAESQRCNHQRRFLEYLSVPFDGNPPGSTSVWRELIAKLNVAHCAPAPGEREGEGCETDAGHKSDADLLDAMERILSENEANTPSSGSLPVLDALTSDEVVSAIKSFNGQADAPAVYLEDIQESMNVQQQKITDLISEGKTLYESLNTAEPANVLLQVQQHNQHLEALFTALSAQKLLTGKYRNQASEFYVKFNLIRQEKKLIAERHQALLHNCSRLISRYNTLRLQYKKLYDIASVLHIKHKSITSNI
ncbi:MAG: hypothetical protein EPN21_12975 [Methylococcaceae bacterium]|nr:MAG: hypothetical protein EPN21_12975 [Methylococcaceae bacterium]